MLSYQADMTLSNNPFELGMDRLVDLDAEIEFVGKKALQRIRQNGVTQRQVGLRFDGAPLSGSNDAFWPVKSAGQRVGYVTSAVHSPRLEANIALAMVATSHEAIGTELTVEMPGDTRAAEVVAKPFYDPKKALAAAS